MVQWESWVEETEFKWDGRSEEASFKPDQEAWRFSLSLREERLAALKSNVGGRIQGMKGLGAFVVDPSLESHLSDLRNTRSTKEALIKLPFFFFSNYFLIRKLLCIYELITKKRKRKKNKIAAIADL